MRKKLDPVRKTWGPVAALTLCALLPVACGPAADPQGEAAAASRSATAEAEWRWLVAARQKLDGKRAELAALRSQPPAAARQPRIAQLETEVDGLARELGRRLVELLNSDPPVAGEPLTERQKSAIRMKSDEDILLARDYIERGGDYRRAIEIYESALVVDPTYARLKEELDRARSQRYMTRERFEQVKEGMKADEVRGLLGQPNLHNVKDYKDKGVSAWFYPKDASGAAAAVYFEKKGGETRVYAANFDAIAGSAAPAAPPSRAAAESPA
jgi:hypothetical protein